MYFPEDSERQRVNEGVNPVNIASARQPVHHRQPVSVILWNGNSQRWEFVDSCWSLYCARPLIRTGPLSRTVTRYHSPILELSSHRPYFVPFAQKKVGAC